MQIEGTKEAFKALLSKRGMYKRLGVDTSTVANWKRSLAEGTGLTIDKMEEVLLRAGAKVVKEKLWRVDVD